MNIQNSVEPKQRFSLTDIDSRLEYITELAEALGVDPNKIISDILTSLKLKLNSEIKKISSTKRQYLLEYLFPYAVLDDYAPLVSYLLEHEDNIPEVVMEKLLHDATYSVFLTPSVKVNIYKNRRDYFMEDVEKEIDSLSNNMSPFATVIDRCPNGDKSYIQSIFLENINVLSPSSFAHLTGSDPILKNALCECIIKYITTKQLSTNHQSQLYNLLFQMIKENNSILLPLSKEEITPSEESQISMYMKKLLNALTTVIDSDRTISKDPRRHGESDIYDPVTKSLFNLYKEMKGVSSTSDSNTNRTLYASKRSSLFVSCIDRMMSHDFQRIFSAPVTDAIAPDYKDIIKHPMDLSTMKAKVSQYTSVREIQKDMELIIHNSEVYNGTNAPITQLGYDLRRHWIKILQQTEEQDKKLQAQYQIEAVPATAAKANSPPKKALPFLLLITAIAFSTPAFNSQLYRAIFQRITYLCGKEKPPSDSGIVDPILFIYLQFLLLTCHIPDLLASIRGESEFFPESLFDMEHKAESIQEFVEQAMYIFQLVIYSRLDEDLMTADAEIFDGLRSPNYRFLVYAGCASQLARLNDMTVAAPPKAEQAILSNFYTIIRKIPAETLLNEWSWIESVVAAQIVKRSSLHLPLLALLLEQLLVPCMQESALFTTAFKTFSTFLQCLKRCELVTDDIISQISSSINKCSVQKHSIEELDEATKSLIKETSGTVSDFRIIFLQLLLDYAITGDSSSFTKPTEPTEPTELTELAETLPPPVSEKRSSPSPEQTFQDDEEDDFY